MKTNKFSTTLVGLGALTLALSLNFIYTSNDYGISDNSLSAQVLAQTDSSGGSSGSGEGSGSNSGSGSGTSKYKFKKIVEIEEVKTIGTCDGINHVTIEQKGIIRSCHGDGVLNCIAGWFPIEPASDPIKSECPGWWECTIR